MSGTTKPAFEISTELYSAAKKFKSSRSKTTDALIIRVDPVSQTIDVEESHEDISLEDLGEELPTAEPRYLLVNYERIHSDGRKSYPLVFIYYTPYSSSMDLRLIYSTSKIMVENSLKAGSKSLELRCGDELTEEWLEEGLTH